MNGLKKISVIIPTYNVEKFISEAIYSIINQSKVNVEIIIVDDCSTDDTYQILKNIKLSHPEIVLIRNDKNIKICKTLNKALEQVTGDYIARFDGDDIALPERLYSQLQHLEKFNLDLVGCQMIAIDEKGIEFSRSSLPVGIERINKTMCLRSPIAHIWLAKKEVYEKLCGYRDIPYAEDYDFILRAIDFGFKCDNSPLYLMKIRHRMGNTSSVAGLEQRKIHNYVLALHKERKTISIDSFNPEVIDKLTKSSFLAKTIHTKSNEYLYKYQKALKIHMKFIFLIIAFISSPYNAQYIIRRFLYDIKMKILK
ncbi:glycosyltransferase family 2 protein [Photobacterium damselae]